jgi:uncharacterized protein YkwD
MRQRIFRLLRLTLIVLSLAATPLAVFADVVDAVNDARLQGCYASAGANYRLRENTRLDEAARRISRGESLQNASQHAGYRFITSAAVQMSNVPYDRDVQKIVTQRFRSQICDRTLRDIGVYRRGPDVWLMVASPFVAPAPSDREDISRRVLQLTNEARARPRRCGRESFPAAPPLMLAPLLERAALAYSQDMAAHSYMDHTGRDGSSPDIRITRTGYKWRAIGENLASGITTPEEVVKGWVGSPHHCENLMSARFTQMGIGYAVNGSSEGGIYWAQEFGTPP